MHLLLHRITFWLYFNFHFFFYTIFILVFFFPDFFFIYNFYETQFRWFLNLFYNRKFSLPTIPFSFWCKLSFGQIKHVKFWHQVNFPIQFEFWKVKERNNPWINPWFKILLQSQSIVYVRRYDQCLEYLTNVQSCYRLFGR